VLGEFVWLMMAIFLRVAAYQELTGRDENKIKFQ
jgi:hypothetical protein